MRIISSAALAMVAVYAMPALAQTADFKCAAPGTVVEFSDGLRTTWVNQEGNVCRLQQKRRDGSEATLNWYAPAVSQSVSAGSVWANQVKPWTLWPLAVGKKISARYDGPGQDPGFSGSWTVTITVEKFEKVTTKAGTFDAFVVAYQSDQIGRSFRTILRNWYAPDPGVTVKFDYSTNNETQRSNGEAISIKR